MKPFANLLVLVLLVAPLLYLAISCASAADLKTIVKDANVQRKLLGRHMLSLQWLHFGKNQYGSASVTRTDNQLLLAGEQVSKEGDPGYLKINGRITEVNSSGFKFHGKIVYSVKSIKDGKECVRDGDYTFLAKGARKYWRMQEMESSCSEVTDYVDLYF
ncbi:MAG TPA: hypothetical protein V6C76_06810 [Drouetiella sp.]